VISIRDSSADAILVFCTGRNWEHVCYWPQ